MSFRDLVELVREDWESNDRDWTRPGFRALFMYRFGVWRMSIRSPLLRMPCSVAYRWMHRSIRNHYGIELHYTAKVGRRVRIPHHGGIVLENHVTIGDGCLLRHNITIGLTGGSARRKGSAVLGEGVQVGVGAVIIGPVTIGDGAVIAPNAVVTADVAPGAIATGPPARVIPPATKKVGDGS